MRILFVACNRKYIPTSLHTPGRSRRRRRRRKGSAWQTGGRTFLAPGARCSPPTALASLARHARRSSRERGKPGHPRAAHELLAYVCMEKSSLERTAHPFPARDAPHPWSKGTQENSTLGLCWGLGCCGVVGSP